MISPTIHITYCPIFAHHQPHLTLLTPKSTILFTMTWWTIHPMTFKICTAVVSANTPHFGAFFPLLALRSGFFLSLRLWNGGERLVFLGLTCSLPFSWQSCGAIPSDSVDLTLKHPAWMNPNMIPFQMSQYSSQLLCVNFCCMRSHSIPRPSCFQLHWFQSLVQRPPDRLQSLDFGRRPYTTRVCRWVPISFSPH